MDTGGPLQSQWERRRHERRRRAGFRLHERRTGFDRRGKQSNGPGGLYRSFLVRLREDARLLAVLLGLINILNLADLSLTLVALERGGQEANPVLAPLFSFSPYAAAAFKAAMVLAVSLVVWDGRRYRRLLETGLVVMGIFMLVVAYQIGGLLLLT